MFCLAWQWARSRWPGQNEGLLQYRRGAAVCVGECCADGTAAVFSAPERRVQWRFPYKCSRLLDPVITLNTV